MARVISCLKIYRGALYFTLYHLSFVMKQKLYQAYELQALSVEARFWGAFGLYATLTTVC